MHVYTVSTLLVLGKDFLEAVVVELEWLGTDTPWMSSLLYLFIEHVCKYLLFLYRFTHRMSTVEKTTRLTLSSVKLFLPLAVLTAFTTFIKFYEHSIQYLTGNA